ncbi:Beta-galactosidase [termite gut metagenome]|jgi:beta-galactosidase|uniref:Beta-galactosidase n=1 Tax=termite gut metagenome TaxID=433724 RepID=A0A5J4SIL0_9ZZZZ
MKQIFGLLCLIFCTIPVCAQQSNSRVITPFDANWKFALSDYKKASNAGFNDKSWRVLDLPHDWSIEGKNLQTEQGGGNVGYFPTGIGWYRKTFDISNLNKDKKIRIEFDGVYENSEIWINGTYLGKRPYGYTSFSYDLTPYLKPKGNVVSVRVDNSHQPNSRWYSGSGIYRHVRLVETNQIHFEKWGIFSYTKEIGDDRATLSIKASVANEKTIAMDKVMIKNVLYTKSGVEVASSQSSIDLKANTTKEVEQEIAVSNPALWSLDNPNLYTLASYVYVNGNEEDCELNTIGIRTIQCDVNKGFLLNGERVKMKGVNLHHDAGAVGTAVPERVWERRIEILKSGGCNAIRTSHNPPAPEFLDLCDQLGILVMDEAFDEWLVGKRDYSYKLYFANWYEQDLKAMLLRDRNHPSVVMWSIGNEIPDQGTAEGSELAKKMIAICHSLDPTRLVTAGNDNIAADKNRATEEYLAAYENDIVGYNYPDRYHERRELLYSIDKAKYLNRRVVATETSGIGGNRVRTAIPSMSGFNLRRGSSAVTQLIDVEQRWKFTLLNDYVIGDFIWTGIDYYGETFWPSRGASSGYLDNCGFKKDGYYFFKSIWTNEPVLHLTSNWNREGEEGKVVPVICFTNCSEVELFINNNSYGVKTFEFPRTGNSGNWNSYEPEKVFTSTADLHLAWDVVYQPGEIKAVGKKDGKEYVSRIVTTGAPIKIRLSADRDVIKALPSDVAHITVEILDKNDNLVPYADNLVKFEIDGAVIIGVESGNLSNLSSVKAHERKAYGGLCQAILQAKKEGVFYFKAISEGLQSAELEITAIK